MRPILLIVLLLSACGTAEEGLPSLLPDDAFDVVDDRELVSEVTDLRLNRSAGGVIVEAYGRAPGGGAWDAELIPTTPDGGVLTMEFRARPVGEDTSGGAPVLVAGAFLSDIELRDVRTIRVAGASNSQSGAR